ncbi:DNA-binding NtrC family response regulator [Novosphingobium chloroacetimidivorans]|uniref:DNA-binding NtrC family response regulator n=2 Tax=Novosphingobium chloroacetimidivorans TaxID=1428314 RepID=A0A7W7KCQ9_9SPHN|nr:DNA-binding NtrC family response regulator [Novosphingobium chloroacetimidivorans]
MRSYSESALTSALFGHEKGAFPGAFAKHVGALQHCYGGTLVLQEVNRMPASVQQRLAAALSDGRLRPLGASHSFDLNVRILATSNQPLNEIFQANSFCADLSKALGATRLEMPPLRERVGDIPALSRFFLSIFQQRSRTREVTINDGAYDRLCSYDWPGNIRQLRSVLLRASALCDGDALTADHFPALNEWTIRTSPGDLVTRRVPDEAGVEIYGADGHLRTLEQIEADVIQLAIGRYSGRMTEIARRLRIGRSTLYRKLNNLEAGPLTDRRHR